jgi:hypothetical protein
LPQHFADVPEGENAKKALDARANLKLGARVFVEARHLLTGTCDSRARNSMARC